MLPLRTKKKADPDMKHKLDVQIVEVSSPKRAAEVESVALIRERLAKALEWVDPWKLYPAPDCGLVFLAPEVAKQKLIHLTAAADDLRNSFMHE